MSISRTDWIVLGANLGKDGLIDYPYIDAYENDDIYSFLDVSEVGQMTIIPDVEYEDYFVVGYVLAHSNDFGGFGNIQEFGTGDVFEKEEIISFIHNHFDITIPHNDIKVLVFTKWE